MATRTTSPSLAVLQVGSHQEVQPLNEDARLVARHLAGDPRAFAVLCNKYRRLLIIFIVKMIGDMDESEDLVQETFLRVSKHLHRFNLEKKFSTWVFTIASNLAKNELRRRSRHPLVLEQQIREQWPDKTPAELEWIYACDRYNPHDLYQRRYLLEIVEETISKLPEHHRVLFVLREIEGKTYEEMQEITGIKLGTVKSRLSRARDNFAAMIQPLLR